LAAKAVCGCGGAGGDSVKEFRDVLALLDDEELEEENVELLLVAFAVVSSCCCCDWIVEAELGN